MKILSFYDPDWIIFLFVAIAGIIAWKTGKLTFTASIAGVMAALLVYLATGLTGLAMLGAFFILGTFVTSYKKEYKVGMQLARPNEDKRNVGQVLANGGVASILALIYLSTKDHVVLQVMIAASLASATSDTLSSELGNVYGRNFYNLLTLKRDKRGLDGVISVEGTLFGVLGSAVIAFIFSVGLGWSYAFFVIVLSGFIGNLSDSMLGALFERKGKLDNNAVNFLNTAIAAMMALLLMNM
jgi:uncharacterized protein (TIGR00297 family)